MKKPLKALAAAALVLATVLPAAAEVNQAALDLILQSGSTHDGFSGPQITDQQIEVILRAGAKAPSALNKQPWHFTVVKNSELLKSAIAKEGDGAVAFIVSHGPDVRSSEYGFFDCALAIQNMSLAAQAMGLGAHIYATGVQAVSAPQARAALSIPEGYTPVAILTVGTDPDFAHIVSHPSPRVPLEGIYNVVE